MKLVVGHFKQELIRDYNELNLRMFDIGVKSQKVEIVGDKILISSPIIKEFHRSKSQAPAAAQYFNHGRIAR